MTRDWLWRGLAMAVVVALVAWLASCTEWVEVETPTPLRGEAARNDLHAVQTLAARLGATVVKPTHLAEMPPPGATLLLTSWSWDLFPDRAQRLKAWVEGGGHLVLFAANLGHPELEKWVPVERLSLRDDEADDEEEHPSGAEEEQERSDDVLDTPPVPARAASAPWSRLQRSMPCRNVAEATDLPPAYATGAREFRLCDWRVAAAGWTLHARRTTWSLDSDEATLVVRAPVGRGQVTVIEPDSFLDNEALLKGDNGLVAVATLQVRPGVPLWFVAEESRPPLPKWLWQQAWVVIVLAGAAIALAVWRGAVRFGPRLGAVLPGRRSMVEQISGTAGFLRREGPEALLGAQVRALEAAAALHIRRYDTLDRTARAAAIAQATGLDAKALGLALDKRLARQRVDLPATLELLETARRLLLQPARTSRK
jgi:hypothetical protein